MKVAFSSSTGAHVDGNFRTSSSFSVWDIGPRESYYVTTRFIKAAGVSEDDRIALRAEAVRDCAIVCARQINGPSAAKLVNRSVHPMKTGTNVPIETIIGKLQSVLDGTPPPWLKQRRDEVIISGKTGVSQHCL